MLVGPVELVRGMASPANRSGCCALLTWEGPLGCGVDRWEDDRSRLCFSFTRLSGTSSSPSTSSVDGSGIGPSITQRFDSYLVLIKFSILASDGTWPGASFDSQYLFALALPQRSTLCNCSSVQESKSTDFTLLI